MSLNNRCIIHSRLKRTNHLIFWNCPWSHHQPHPSQHLTSHCPPHCAPSLQRCYLSPHSAGWHFAHDLSGWGCLGWGSAKLGRPANCLLCGYCCSEDEHIDWMNYWGYSLLLIAVSKMQGWIIFKSYFWKILGKNLYGIKDMEKKVRPIFSFFLQGLTSKIK